MSFHSISIPLIKRTIIFLRLCNFRKSKILFKYFANKLKTMIMKRRTLIEWFKTARWESVDQWVFHWHQLISYCFQATNKVCMKNFHCMLVFVWFVDELIKIWKWVFKVDWECGWYFLFLSSANVIYSEWSNPNACWKKNWSL